MRWDAITAICAAIVAGSGFAAWFVKITVREEIRRLNGYYIRSDDTKLTGAVIEQRLTALEHRRNHA